MIIPMYAPFLLLAGVCAVYPLPHWTRRVDWLCVAVWASYFGLLAGFAFGMYEVAS